MSRRSTSRRPGRGAQREGVGIPRTVVRSTPEAQRTYAKAESSAESTYGSGERAHRPAIAALRHGFEKVGDQWESKAQEGPSDPQAGKTAAYGPSPAHDDSSAGGVDVRGHSKPELYARARALHIPRISRMRKSELARAIAKRERSVSRHAD